jgi:hypothetical protein
VEVSYEYADAGLDRVPFGSCSWNAVPDHCFEQEDQRSLKAKAEEEVFLILLFSYYHTINDR